MGTPVKSKCCAKLREVIKTSLLNDHFTGCFSDARPNRQRLFNEQRIINANALIAQISDGFVKGLLTFWRMFLLGNVLELG